MVLANCNDKPLDFGPHSDAQGHTRSSKITADINSHVLDDLSFENQQDFVDANRGHIASVDVLITKKPIIKKNTSAIIKKSLFI